jgi:hypothetical protein
MKLAAQLWSRTQQAWGPDAVDRAISSIPLIAKSMDQKSAKAKKKHNAGMHPRAKQSQAYITWKEASVRDWLALLQKEAEAPNAAQLQFLHAVIDRCRQETSNFKRSNVAEYDDEPLRCCLLGIPGAGKSACIKWARRFFEECLKWDDGVQFQFLASQNTMAALIGGATVHSWSTIPVNATDAANKVQSKGEDGDIDELFLKALGMRWLLLDEVSTLSPYLLGLLDAYLRRACCRHPYAKHKGRRRPFGGINIVLAGDFWQLTPVKNHSIFANPYVRGYSSEEQKILKMLWRPDDVDSIQQTFLLTESMRSNDEWLNAVLNANRAGAESWEMYCFQHGLPTRNVGTWLPNKAEPGCGDKNCADLASKVWPELRSRADGTRKAVPRRENWLRRQQKECKKCQDERKRRCCVRAQQGDGTKRHLEEPFTSAPYVHPFRHPSYHATQLRALDFAKAAGRRLHWVTAHDQLKAAGASVRSAKEELRKERWLEFHDRFTGGIPGLLPLVVDLPIRFTESLGKAAREMGVFKHTRGILRGWELEAEEQQRMEDTAEPEVVLKRRPTKLYIEIPTATQKMPKTGGKYIYILKVQRKPWTLDKNGNVKISRFGFPIVPDFGGTAHAYCGTTVEAVLGDLLPWHKQPQMSEMLKSYIIKSRVRKAEQVLVVQPYSPQLFRQGVLPGPQLLLDVLQGKTTEAEAKTAWKKIEKAKTEEKPKGESWLQRQTLPCRRCSDNNVSKEEVRKPISAFGTESLARDVWQNIVSRGQDLICFQCRSELGDDSTRNFICCEGCGIIQTLDKFADAEKERWQGLHHHSILCLSCTGAARTRSDAHMIHCYGPLCGQEHTPGLREHTPGLRPEYHFVDSLLTNWRAKSLQTAIQCARCWVRGPDCDRKDEAARTSSWQPF